MNQFGITHVSNQTQYNDTWCLGDFTYQRGSFLWHYRLAPDYCTEGGRFHY